MEGLDVSRGLNIRSTSGCFLKGLKKNTAFLKRKKRRMIDLLSHMGDPGLNGANPKVWTRSDSGNLKPERFDKIQKTHPTISRCF